MEHKTGRGERIAQARRLLGVALHQDMPRRAAAELFGVSSPTWTRWEAEDDRPTYENLQRFAQLCQEHGIAGVTAAWLEFAEGEGPLTITPVVKHQPARHIKKHGRVVKPGDAKTERNRRRA